MSFAPHGKHLIAGDWVASEQTFMSEPANGEAHAFSIGTPSLVDQACRAAEDAFLSYGYSSRADRAAFLNAIADEIEARAVLEERRFKDAVDADWAKSHSYGVTGVPTFFSNGQGLVGGMDRHPGEL